MYLDRRCYPALEEMVHAELLVVKANFTRWTSHILVFYYKITSFCISLQDHKVIVLQENNLKTPSPRWVVCQSKFYQMDITSFVFYFKFPSFVL